MASSSVNSCQKNAPRTAAPLIVILGAVHHAGTRRCNGKMRTTPRQPVLAAALDATCVSEGAVRFHHLLSGNADQPFHRVYVLCEEAVEQSIFVQQPEKEVGWSGDELSRTIGLLT
jgi:hypothetical protein